MKRETVAILVDAHDRPVAVYAMKELAEQTAHIYNDDEFDLDRPYTVEQWVVRK